jgi:hypothetical protein
MASDHRNKGVSDPYRRNPEERKAPGTPFPMNFHRVIVGDIRVPPPT